jgi:gliding motility-associated-like protein
MKRQTSLRVFFIIITLLYSYTTFAQFEFIENKGQWDEHVLYKMELNNGALFIENSCLTFNFISTEDMNYSAAHHGSEEHSHSLLRAGHAYKMNFINANKNSGITKSDKTIDYCNYYIGKDPSKWASYVSKYHTIKYNDLYDGIDFNFHSNSYGMKYDIIIHPGANYRDVLFSYEGADLLSLEDGNLIISTTVNEVKELNPFTYQIFDGDTVEVECNYLLKRNRICFDVIGEYDKTKDLIIDPSLVFSTYSGSVGDNWGFTATWDYDDNVYSGGIVFAVGYPSTIGAYQVDFAGGTPPIAGSSYYADGCDVGIIKYNEDGSIRLFATYLGGANGQEMPHSLVVNEENELIIMGTTGSPDFPVSFNAFQSQFGGGDSIVYDNVIGFDNGVDIFVMKLSEDGSQLLGSTYVGGSKNDGLNYQLHYNYPDPNTGINYVSMHGNDSLYYNYGDGARGEVIVDNKSMIYVGTNTFSNDFPSGINSGFQSSSGGGQDGIVFKFNTDLSQMIWSTYMGGSEDDAIFSLSLTESEDVIVAGGAVSDDFPTTPGVYNQTHNGGSTDAFVSKINMNGNILLASTFFGSDEYDNAFFVRTDKFNNIFICGQTKASASSLIYNADYSVPNSGQFIAKFNNDLSELIWSTVFGSGNGRPNISITAFAVDVCNRVYLSGWGREWAYSYYDAQGNYYTWTSVYGTMGMPLTADAIQTNTDGQDFYVLVLNEDASNLEYASYFGEVHYASCGYSGHDHVDGGTSRFDKKGHIIQSVCASCGGCQEFPTEPNPGVWSTSNNASNCNNAVFKIRIIENLAEANFEPVPVGCAPYVVQFSNNSQGTTFVWDFGDGSPESTEYDPSHSYTEGGEYTVSLIVGDPASCNFYDTIIRVINVVEPGESFLPPIEICPGESIILGPDGNYPSGTSFQWVEGTDLNNYYVQNPVATPLESTDYLLVATSVCIDSVWQSVVVYEPDIDISICNDTLICEGDPAYLFAGTTGDVSSWQWSSNSLFTNTLSTTTEAMVYPTSNTTYYVRAREDVCNTFVTEQVMVSLHQFNYNLTPTYTICLGGTETLSLINQNPTDVLTYNWEPTASIVSGENTNSPVVSPSSSTTYHVTITNQIGCTTTDQVNVNIDNININPPVVVNNLCYDYCLGSASITVTGIPPYTYEWSNGATDSEITELCADTYSVTVIDDLGCTITTNIDVIQPPELLADFINVVIPLCDGVGYGSATVDAVGGTPPYTYFWQFGGNQAINNNCLVGENVVTVTDANSCSTVISVDMPAPGTLVSEIEDYEMIKCYGNCDAYVVVSAELGTPPYMFNWSNGLHTQTISDLCEGSYVVTVLDSDDCVTHEYIYISEPDTLITNALINDQILCYGELGDIELQTTGGTQPFIFNWSNGSNLNELDDVEAGVYQVTVTDANNCIDYAYVELIQPDELLMDTTIINMLCNNVCNGRLTASVSGGTTPYYYDWSNGSSQYYADELCDGDYELILKDANNCIITEDFTVENEGYVPDLEAQASVYEVFAGEQVALIAQSSLDGSYSWDNVDLLNNHSIPNPVATLVDSTLFRVLFRDENNCLATDTIFIRVKEVICGDPYVYVPNAFSPNFDGKNDYFKPYYPLSLVTDVYFAVYDRWGNVIFETTDLDGQGWDGTYQGEKLATDVYVFWLRARCLNGEEYNHKGNVTLLR